VFFKIVSEKFVFIFANNNVCKNIYLIEYLVKNRSNFYKIIIFCKYFVQSEIWLEKFFQIFGKISLKFN